MSEDVRAVDPPTDSTDSTVSAEEVSPSEGGDVTPASAPVSGVGWRAIALVTGVSAALQALVWALTYWVHEILRVKPLFFAVSDLWETYVPYAMAIAHGSVPYRDFSLEYPPLYVPILWLAGSPDDPNAWVHRFALTMALFLVATAAIIGIAAMEPGRRWRGFAAGGIFAVCAALLGPVSANRYDPVVALVIGLALLFAVRRQWELAALSLGLGFSLKITPVFLLLPLLMMIPKPRLIRSFGAFAVTAGLPYLVVEMLGGGEGLGYMLRYHATRALEIESVFATPLWIPRMFGGSKVVWETTSGSQTFVGASPVLLGQLSSVALVVLLVAAYWLIWRRRSTIAAEPRLIALAVLVTMLASIVGSKVLSPQYMVWLLPPIALVALDRKWLGGVMAAILLLTQAFFPGYYWSFVIYQLPWVIGFVVARNLLLVIALAMGFWSLWRLPAAEPESALVES